MDHAKYGAVKAARKAKDALRAKKKSGRTGYLERKIALWNKRFNLKKSSVGRKFDARKNARIAREHGRWNRKSAKWGARAARWKSHWEHKATRFNARMAKSFG
ncbi:MAG: hypothetical protein KJ928_01490 [Candidatus Altiarchaeota archaeon]|nr:hypothetical protein [Candidatus Altiarchaeota archaeon]